MSKIAENLRLAEQLQEAAARATVSKQFRSARIFLRRAERYQRAAEDEAAKQLQDRWGRETT